MKPKGKAKLKAVEEAVGGNADVLKDKSRVLRKQNKQLRFAAKLQENGQTLSASKTIGKKKRKRTREKASKVLNNLSSLLQTLPTKEEVLASVPTFKSKLRRNKSHQKLVVNETKQLAAVLAHPEFQTNPFAAIQQHLINTLPAPDPPAPKQQSRKEQKKKKPTTKISSLQQMEE